MASRFLVIPTIGLWKSLATDSSFVFLMNTVVRLVERGNYAFVVLPKDIDYAPLEKWKRPGIMFLSSDIPARALDTQMAVVDQAIISTNFGFQYGKYVVDAGIVLHGSQVLPLKQAVHPRGPYDCFPVFCLEQGVSWIDTEAGYDIGRFDEELNVLGASYAHLCTVSEKDRDSYMEKARHFTLSPSHLDRLLVNSFAGCAPVDIPLLQSIAKAAKKYETPTLLYAARTNKTKHPEEIVAIFDDIYKSGDNVQIKYVTQTSELKFSIMAKRRGLLDERQYIHPHVECGPLEFFSEAAKSHVFICWSDSESFNGSAVEASLLGCVYLCRDLPSHRKLYGGDLGGDVFWLNNRLDAVEKVRWVAANYEKAYAMQVDLRARFTKREAEGDLSAHVHQRAIDFHKSNVVTRDGKLYYYKLADNAELTAIIAGTLGAWKEPEISLADVLVSLEAHGYAFSTDNLYRAISRVMPVNWNLHQMMKMHFNLTDTCKTRHPRYLVKK